MILLLLFCFNQNPNGKHAWMNGWMDGWMEWRDALIIGLVNKIFVVLFSSEVSA